MLSDTMSSTFGVVVMVRAMVRMVLYLEAHGACADGQDVGGGKAKVVVLLLWRGAMCCYHGMWCGVMSDKFR